MDKAAVLTCFLVGEISENGAVRWRYFLDMVNSLDQNVKQQFLLALLNQNYCLYVFVWFFTNSE